MNKTDSNSIVRRVGAFQIADLQMGAKQYAEETLDGLTWHDVKGVSSAAALFYSWVKKPLSSGSCIKITTGVVQ